MEVAARQQTGDARDRDGAASTHPHRSPGHGRNAALEDSGDEEAGELAREAAVEHELVDLLFERMMRMRTASDNWKARATVVKERLEHHIEEEQDEVFTKLEALFDPDELAQMAERFESDKGNYRMPGTRQRGAQKQGTRSTGNGRH